MLWVHLYVCSNARVFYAFTVCAEIGVEGIFCQMQSCSNTVCSVCKVHVPRALGAQNCQTLCFQEILKMKCIGQNSFTEVLSSIFSDVCTACMFLLALPVTIASCERSF